MNKFIPFLGFLCLYHTFTALGYAGGIGSLKPALPGELTPKGDVTVKGSEFETDSEYRVLEISGSGLVRFQPGLEKIGTRPFYVSIELMPALYRASPENPADNTQISFLGLTVGFRVIEGNAPDTPDMMEILISDDREGLLSSNLYYALEPDLSFPDWISFMLRVDPEHGYYDVYHKNMLWIADLPLREGGEQDAHLYSGGQKAAFLKKIEFDRNWMFEDRDLDGIPDDFELQFTEEIRHLGRYEQVEPLGVDLVTAYVQTRGKY